MFDSQVSEIFLSNTVNFSMNCFEFAMCKHVKFPHGINVPMLDNLVIRRGAMRIIDSLSQLQYTCDEYIISETYLGGYEDIRKMLADNRFVTVLYINILKLY